MNIKAVLAVLGFILAVIGVFMLTALPFAYSAGGSEGGSILLSSVITLLAGALLWFGFRQHRHTLGLRDGFLVVALSWTVASVFGSLPYLISGTIPSVTDAYFETMSGFTTTGATILADIEIVPIGILFWRSTTQWIGGMGIILLSVAILPMLGVGGMQLFAAEVPGLTVEKLTPRIGQTARILWGVYVLLTTAETVILMIGGMTFYDALSHAFTTVSTGGFSTKNASIAHYSSPFIQYSIIVFMFAAGISFTLHFRGLKGDLRAYLRDNEFVAYALLIVVIVFLILPGIPAGNLGSAEEVFRSALFQVVSIITTTGFITSDYELWLPFTHLILLLMMITGACAGSTAGGVKIARILLLLKNGYNELKKLVHPKAILPLRYNGKAVKMDLVTDVLAYFVLFITIFALGTIIMAALGMDIISAAGAVVASLGNIGPGLGSVGAVDNYSQLPALGKWVLSFCMLTGRLELFTVLVLLSPVFWRR